MGFALRLEGWGIVNNDATRTQPIDFGVRSILFGGEVLTNPFKNVGPLVSKKHAAC
jgi:hypothetical protein